MTLLHHWHAKYPNGDPRQGHTLCYDSELPLLCEQIGCRANLHCTFDFRSCNGPSAGTRSNTTTVTSTGGGSESIRCSDLHIDCFVHMLRHECMGAWYLIRQSLNELVEYTNNVWLIELFVCQRHWYAKAVVSIGKRKRDIVLTPNLPLVQLAPPGSRRHACQLLQRGCCQHCRFYLPHER